MRSDQELAQNKENASKLLNVKIHIIGKDAFALFNYLLELITKVNEELKAIQFLLAFHELLTDQRVSQRQTQTLHKFD